jgi:CubicO group peptidase (beta-lactamase class C family)
MTAFPPLAVLVAALWAASGTMAYAADQDKPVFPGAEWERVAKPESIGYSSAKLEALRVWLKTQPTTSMLVSVGGRILFEYGDLKYVSKVASVRKSILGMMYGKYVANGTIDLQKRVKALGLDDVQKFLPREEFATLDMLLMSRSGVYLPEGAPDPDPTDNPPARGSQYPGAFFYYNGWDFNAAGTAFEKLTGKNIYDALQTDLADPIGMQDYDKKRQKKNSGLPYSVHPEYAMYVSTRDMARIGLLMLRGGEWNGKRLLPEHWSDGLTQLVTPAHEIFPVSLRNAQTVGPSRWGYGRMWWVWDQPRLPGGLMLGDFYGAYTAWGTGGQFITVLPVHDMVVAHKVEIEGDSAGDMSPLEQSTILQMAIAARCNGRCK